MNATSIPHRRKVSRRRETIGTAVQRAENEKRKISLSLSATISGEAADTSGDQERRAWEKRQWYSTADRCFRIGTILALF